MTKKEVIWREIINRAIEGKKLDFTQKELALYYGFSLSTVFNALKAPRASGIVKKRGRGFVLTDLEKFIYLWATERNLDGEIIYQTHCAESPQAIEGLMPPGTIFGAYSAFRQKYADAPADYDKVYVYADKEVMSAIHKRFPPRKGYANLVVLKSDAWLSRFGPVAPDGQTLVDLWNLKDWFAKDYFNALKSKLAVF